MALKGASSLCLLLICCNLLLKCHAQFTVSTQGEGYLTVSLNGQVWFEEIEGLSDVNMHKENRMFSRKRGSLALDSTNPLSGIDSIGSYSGEEMTWAPADTYFYTSYRVYDQENAVVFRQDFRNHATNILGTDVSGLLDHRYNEVCTVYPSLVPRISESDRGYMTFGGRMSGTPCLAVGKLLPTTFQIRDGAYGGPTVFFNQDGDEVVIISALNEFMVSNLRWTPNENPDTENHPGVWEYGLMGSIKMIEAPGLQLETIMVTGQSFADAFQRWGQILRRYHGTQAPSGEDVASDYLSYWTDNGAYYYYHTMENMNYEDTLIQIKQDLDDMSISIRSMEIDSWWYPKDAVIAVEEWTALPTIFPNGLEYMQEQVGLPIIAHNRHWSRNATYAKENGGGYDFIREVYSLPQDEQFWPDFFANATQWGLKVYNQDWQDFQFVLMNATVDEIHVARTWLLQMATGAEANDVHIQYCMTLPRELLQSVETHSVTRVRASEDYFIGEQWRIGITSHLAMAIGLRPFKDVFWTATNNPGNNYYYNCMEVNAPDNPNVPWPINYRYVGPINVTSSGKACIPWADLNLHWRYPLGDLIKNECRSPVGLGNGIPMCYYEASLDTPQEEWLWENCDIPICDENCTRVESEATVEKPYCEELIETNPDLEAAVSTLSRGGVGFGDSMEYVDKAILDKTCREDGKILTVDHAAVAAPIQILELAFGGAHRPQNPYSDEVGEIWASHAQIGPFTFGVLFSAGNRIDKAVSIKNLGLSLSSGEKYLVSKFFDDSYIVELDDIDTATLTLELQDVEDFDIFTFSPILEANFNRRLAILGDKRKYVSMSGTRFQSISLTSTTLEITSEGAVPVTMAFSASGSDWGIGTMSCDGTDLEMKKYVLELENLIYYCINA